MISRATRLDRKPQSQRSVEPGLRVAALLVCCVAALVGCVGERPSLEGTVAYDENVLAISIEPVRNLTAGRDDDMVTLTNLTGEPILAPIYLLVRNISHPTVESMLQDELLLGGEGAYRIDLGIAPGASVQKQISFSNPNRARYTYDVVVHAVPPTIPVADLDGDGIPDDEDPDIDGDRYSNEDEASVGSDPRDPASVPADGDLVDYDATKVAIEVDAIRNQIEGRDDDTITLTNLTSQPIVAPIYLLIRNISIASVQTIEHDEVLPDGEGVYRVDGDLAPGASVDKIISFSNVDRARYTYDLIVRAAPQLLPEPDLDGDGIPDAQDPDIDGDGFSNDDETAVGSDPRDGASVPADLDGDFIPDALDPDRDGDGFSNDEEVTAGTNPDDPNDFPIPGGLSLAVSGPATRSVQTPEFTLSGTLRTDFQGTLVATSDRMAGVEFTGILTSPGSWSVEVALAPAVNVVSVTASEGSDSETVQVQVTRLVPPAIQIDDPRPNSVVNQEVITVVGRITDPVSSNPPRVAIQGKSVTSISTGAGVFDFAVPNVLLTEGLNLLLVEAFSDQLSSSIEFAVTLDTDAAPAPPPLITITSPVVNGVLASDSFELVGTVQAFTGVPLLSINAVPIVLSGNEPIASFREPFGFGGASEITLELVAQDAAGRTTTDTLVYRLDQEAPVVTLDDGLLPPPDLNVVTSNPYPLSGSVQDANLASVTINDEAVSLEVAGPETFTFAVQLALLTSTPTPVEIIATDLAGNSQSLVFDLQTDSTQFIEPLLPVEGAEFIATEATVAVSIAARVSDILPGQTVTARVEPNPQSLPPVLLDVANGLATGDVQLPGVAGNYRIVFEIRNAADEVLASGMRGVSVETFAAGELEVTKVEPGNEARGIEPNQFISAYFNQPIDPTLLTIDVFETAHGLTYVPGDEPGTEAIFARGQVLEEVSRERAPVIGSLFVFPGERIVSFYPDVELAYDAQVYVEVVYDGAELIRWTFRTRELPTFVIGGVTDQLRQTGAGITVALPALDRTTVTNEDGGFAFGFGDTAEERIPSGRYRLVLNPGMKVPDYGTASHWITVQEGRSNDVGQFRVPLLNREVGFRQVTSGDSQVVLAGGDVVLDLSEASLVFPDSRLAGAVHVQFNPVDQVVYGTTQLAIPHWMYGFQPGGITVEGEVGIDFAMPTLFGSHDYISPEAPYVLIMGVDDGANLVVPVGVGIVEAGRVTSVPKLPLTRLDYIGVALVLPEQQSLLESFAGGGISFQELLSALQVEPQS